MSDNESQESLDYLQPGFDPSTLTVPKIRSILVTYNVNYPSAAKKAELVDIFTNEVLPQSRKILKERSRARRTSRGITNADRSETGSTLDEDIMPPPSTTRSRSARKTSSRAKVEDSESETPARTRTRTRSISPVKKTPRASTKHARTHTDDGSSEFDSIRRTVRKTRKSETPVIKTEDVDEDFPRRKLDDTVFSDDNPFQSGSSPLAASRTPSGERRRKTLGETPSTRRKTSTTTTRRRTDVPQTDGITPPTLSKFEIPVSQLSGLKDPDFDENGVETSEDFTPEEQLELVRERSAKGVNAVPQRRVTRPKVKSGGFKAKGPLSVIALTLLGGYATWYRQEKLAVGYCGVGEEPHSILSMPNVELPEWAAQIELPEWLSNIELPGLPSWAQTIIEPSCEPCPQHAYCYENLRTQCEPDFVLKPNPFSLGGLVPIPPTCEPDGEKVRRVKVVADRAVEELREIRAKFECGELVDDAGVLKKTPEIEEEDLKKIVSQKRRRNMGEQEFEDLWSAALGEIKGREEVETTGEGATSPDAPSHTRLRSESLAKIPLLCAIRRSFRLAVARHRLQLGLLTLLSFAIMYARYKYQERIRINAAIPQLVSLTLDRLATQAARHVADKEAWPENYISISQLRDDVLRDEHSLNKRNAIWQKVRNVVEMNANVRSSQRQDRNGEIQRVWEWVGNTASVEGKEEREERRKSGRVSWGAFGDASSPVSGSDGGPEVVQMKWAEGRPIY